MDKSVGSIVVTEKGTVVFLYPGAKNAHVVAHNSKALQVLEQSGVDLRTLLERLERTANLAAK